MGQAATDTRRELEQTRDDLGEHIGELRTRASRAARRSVRAGLIAAGALLTLGASAAAGILVVRRRQPGPVTRGAKQLPRAIRQPALNAARPTDRWLQGRQRRLVQQRDELAQALADRITATQAEAERRANPAWRRALIKGAEAGASVGAAVAVRRLFGEDGQLRRSAEDQPDREVARQRDLVRNAG